MKIPVIFPILLALAGPPVQAQNSDVTFFVIGKHGNYAQSPSGNRESVDYSFFSEIFLTAHGDASDATLRFPTDELVPFVDMREVEGGQRDNIFLISGKDRFTAYADLLDRYPDGEYRVSFSTPSGSVENGLLRFEDRSLPPPPRITVQQGTEPACRMLRPGVDALVSWSGFAEGRADPNDILDDLVFVILTDESGVRVAHSGRPFEGQPYLTYTNTEFTIDGRAIEPHRTYTLSVEHALLDDTTLFDNVPAFTTRAVTTQLELKSASFVQDSCIPVGSLLPEDPGGYTAGFFRWLGESE